MAIMVPLELECTVPSYDIGDGAHYKTPKLVSGLALALLQKHRAENHPTPAYSLYTPLKDSVTDSITTYVYLCMCLCVLRFQNSQRKLHRGQPGARY
jgi:hypothetical protein